MLGVAQLTLGGGDMVTEDPMLVRVRKEIDSLAREYSGVLERDIIERCAAESLDLFPEVRVKDFVPLFVSRMTRERLAALAEAERVPA
jgi:hypothetical protein